MKYRVYDDSLHRYLEPANVRLLPNGWVQVWSEAGVWEDIDPATQGWLTVELWTGRTDKDGTDIYQNDFVRKDGEYDGLIDWHFNGWVAHLWYEPGYEWQPLTDRWTEYGRVIGNIHANPELLT